MDCLGSFQLIMIKFSNIFHLYYKSFHKLRIKTKIYVNKSDFLLVLLSHFNLCQHQIVEFDDSHYRQHKDYSHDQILNLLDNVTDLILLLHHFHRQQLLFLNKNTVTDNRSKKKNENKRRPFSLFFSSHKTDD